MSAKNIEKPCVFHWFALKTHHRTTVDNRHGFGERNGAVGTKLPQNHPSTRIETALARPRSFASPRPLARTNETKRFPGWTHPPNLQYTRTSGHLMHDLNAAKPSMYRQQCRGLRPRLAHRLPLLSGVATRGQSAELDALAEPCVGRRLKPHRPYRQRPARASHRGGHQRPPHPGDGAAHYGSLIIR